LNIDGPLKKKLTNLSKHQSPDSSLGKLREKLQKDPPTSEGKYMIRNDILCHRNVRTHPYGRATLSGDLEFLVVEYMHT
jgi:hypothetical protein